MKYLFCRDVISSSNLLSAVSAVLLSPSSALDAFCRALPHSFGDAPHRCVPPFNLHRALVRRNHGRFPSNGFIERAKSTVPTSTASRKTRVRSLLLVDAPLLS